MRICLSLTLQREEFPSDYRPMIISLFKHSLSNYMHGQYFNRYYSLGKMKPFCFSVWLGKSIFVKEKISVPFKHIRIYWSTNDLETGIIFYNALAQLKKLSYPLAFGNTMCLEKIYVEQEEVIVSRDIEVLFASPLCVREHDILSNCDHYYSFNAERFSEHLKPVLSCQLADHNDLSASLLDDFTINPVIGKKTVVRHHGQMIEATLGTFRFQGDIRLLTYFYQAGIGSRKSAGFGYFNIIKQGR